MSSPRDDDHPLPSAVAAAPHAIDRETHPRRCSATTRSGSRCRQYAVTGMAVCRMHGGASPQARAAAQRRKAEAEATVLLERLWDPAAAPVQSPVESLLRLAGRMEHALDVLGARLDVDGLDLSKATSQAWWRVMSELRQALVGLQRLNLEERQVELEAARAEMVVVAFLAALDVLGPAPGDRTAAITAFLDRLGTPVVVAGEVEA